MASVFDISLVEQFSPILAFLLVFVIVYGVLLTTKLFGDNKGFYAIIAFVLGLLSGLVPGGATVIVSMAPWIVLMMLFLLFMFAITAFAGIGQEDVIMMFGGKQVAGWFLIVPLLIILIAALSNAFGQQLLEEGGGGGESAGFRQNITNALFSKQVIGLVIIFVIAAMTIRIITESPK